MRRRKRAGSNRERKPHYERLEVRSVLAAGGLVGQYFHNPDFTGLAYERTEAVNFDWGVNPPAPGVVADTFSVRWLGQVEALYSDQYTFYVTSDEGARLWVNGQPLVDSWTAHTTRTDVGTITLAAGQKYDLRLEYFEGTGAAKIQLGWYSASQAREIIPAERLYSSPQGLYGTYADSSGASMTRIDSAIDFNWGASAPSRQLAADNFDVTWTGQVRADYSEAYTFSIESDDGVRLWIGGELVIDDWDAHTARVATGTKRLEVGKWYDIRLEYYDNLGAAEVSLSWSAAGQTGGATQVIAAANLQAAKPTPQTFLNPLGAGQDPFVTYWDGQYYSVRSSGSSIRIDKATALEEIHPSTPESTTLTAWTAPAGTAYSSQVWAPELHHLNGKWYIYFTASDGANANHRMYVLERDAPDPFGAYVFKGQLSATTNRWAIDGTVLDWNGQLYFIWSGWPGSTDGQQNLYIARMSDPLTISGERYLISTPDYAWEKSGLPINEGPQILVHDGKLHIIYSGSGYWTDNYALGRLTYDGVGSLLSKSSWQKSATPVFQRAGDIVGTGHASFTTSPDGAQNWIVYHAHHDPGVFQEDRDVFIQPFDFDANGYPVFGQPIPASTPQAAPLGFADPERPFLAGDFTADGVVNLRDYAAWRQSYGATVTPGIGADANRNGVIDAGDYTVFRDNLGATFVADDPTLAYWRHEEGAEGGVVAAGAGSVIDSSGSGNDMRTTSASSTAASYSVDVSPLALRSGLTNTLSLDFGPGGDDAGKNDSNYSDGRPINSTHFTALTVELAFKLDTTGGFQSLLGKDGAPISGSPIAPLQIKVRGDNYPGGVANQLFVEWIDGDGDVQFLTSGYSIVAGVWNHVAFVLDKQWAQLSIAGETDDYEVVDALYEQDFAGPSGDVLYPANSPFTVGRGAYNGSATDWSDAHIDEVRITGAALDAGQFLFVPNLGASTSRALVSDQVEEEAEGTYLAEVAIGSPAATPVRSAAALRAADRDRSLLLLAIAENSDDERPEADPSLTSPGDEDETSASRGLDAAFAMLVVDGAL